MELDISLDIEELITKAPNWNLSGDCELLKLMKRISENMDVRANHTFNAMENLDLSVRQTELALETTNNSLRALHFGQQYVEYRIQEDDDEVEATNQDTLPEVKSTMPQKSKDEILEEFLANNIKVFRENYEQVEIDIPDSDDEDGVVTTTCMYRAKNHYDKPLPYIIGTKEWNQHWHVGTIEDANEYSGEEESEEFSESSSSSDGNEAGRDESYDSANVTNVSDWASNTSLNIDKTKNFQRKDSDAKPSFAKQIISATAAKTAPTVSDSSSNTSLDNTQSRHIQIGRQRHPHEHDLFAALRQSPPSDDIPTVSSSSTSSSNVLNRPPHMVQQFPQNAYISSKPPIEVKVQHNLFDEDEIDDVMPSRNSQQTLPTDEKVSTPVKNQIKRKPVNLFDDNDFNSFLSEITDKALARGDSTNVTTSGNKSQVESQKQTNPISKSKPPENSASSSQYSAPVVNQAKRKPSNFFDDNDDDFDPFPSKNTSQAPVNEVTSNTNTLSNKHPKYQNETIPKSKPQKNKDTSDQFKNDNVIDTSNANTNTQNLKQMSIPIPTPRKDASTSQLPKKTINLFDESPPPSPVPSIKQTLEKSDESQVTNRLIAKSLFAGNPDDDFLDDFGSFNIQVDTTKGAINKTSGNASNQPKVKGTISLFSDDDDDELDINNIFSRKIDSSSVLTKKTSARVSLFDDVDDDDRDLFGNKKPINATKTIIPKTLESRTENTNVPLYAQAKSEAKLSLDNAPLIKQELPIKSLNVDLFAEEITQTENKGKLSFDNASLIKQELPIKSLNLDLFADDEIIYSKQPKLSDEKPREDFSKLKKENQSGNGNTEVNEKVQTLMEDKQLTDSDEDNDLFRNSKSFPKLRQIETEEIQNSEMHKQPIMNKTEEFHGSKQNIPNEISSETNIFKDIKVLKYDDDDELFPTSIKSTRTNNQDIKMTHEIPDIVTIEDINDDDDDEMISENKDNFEEELTSVETSVQGLSDSLTNLIIENSPEKMRSSADLDAISKSNQTYNRLFMDEPPDDSEFFQTLGSSKLSSSKIFDLDPDFYESSLPDITNTSKAAAEAIQAISSDYDGLRLFSELPPDDDHESPKKTLQEAISRVETIESGTKRLHTIFYDDFSETTTSSSIAKGNAKETSSVPTVFNDEPPPDIESRSDRDVVDRSVDKTIRDLGTEAIPKREPMAVGKLVKPKININVQALLPSTGAIPKIRKTPVVQSQKSHETVLPTETITSPVQVREQPISRENTPTSSNQNLLSSMNKMRVRVPVKRRPSTRRARQENYRKSLLDEAHVDHDDIDGKEIEVVSPKEHSTKNLTPQKIIIPKTKTFLDTDDDDDEVPFFNPPKSLPTANNFKKPLEINKSKPSVVTKAKELPPPVANFNPYAGMQSSSLANKTYKSFLDTDDDDDDDLFAKIDNMPIKKPTEVVNLPKTIQTTRSQEKPIEKNPGQKVKSSLFGSDDDDDNSEFLSSLKRAPSKPKTATAKGLFSDVDSDDGDDLFGGGGNSKRHTTKSKTQHSKQATGNKEGTRSKTVKKQPPTTASDNPLADLLFP